MNEHNPPMMLPNGYVYGLRVGVGVPASQNAPADVRVAQGLQAMARRTGAVTCPRTKEVFALASLKRVFVM